MHLNQFPQSKKPFMNAPINMFMLNPHRGGRGNLIYPIFWLHVYSLKKAVGSCHSCKFMPVQL